MMKKIAFPLIACLALASSAFAGHEMKETKEYKAVEEPCFKDQELQLDVFGSWTDPASANTNHNGFGGGLGVNYFIMRYVGFGVDGDVYDGHHHAVGDFTGRLIIRYPIEGTICLAPYAFGGGGVMFDDTTVGTWHVGGGLEWRVVKEKIGIFTEGRYTWGAEANNATQVRAGVRFVF